MAVTFQNILRRPVTTQYPDERLTVSRRIRGNEFTWFEKQCAGCFTCARSCPIHCIEIVSSGNGTERTALAPCRQTCPAGVDAARYVRLIAEGKFADALAVVRERLPFPSVCGYICAHPCESKCTRGQIDEPIAIRVLKRFAWEHDAGIWRKQSKVAPPSGRRVAIVGSGPAGLCAGYYLAKLGHAVTAFEALAEPGGMTRYGIPEYRLPKNILRAEIKEIENVGVEIRTNTRVDSLDALFAQGYDAIFLAVGAQQGIGIGVEGEDNPRVMGGVSFLRRVSMGEKVEVGDRVAVIGGGNTAMDSARTARRLGAKEVTIVYRRTRAEMPASHEEIEEALVEGIKIYFLAAPSRILPSPLTGEGKGEGVKLECIRMKLGAPDASGRRRPEPIKGSEFTMDFDTIIAAIGQRPEIPVSFGMKVGRGNIIQTDPDTLATDKKGIFAGGDAVSGPATVIEAVAAGRKAATSIDKYLGGSGIIDEVLAPVEKIPPRVAGPREGWRPEIPTIPYDERINSFKGVELSIDEELAIEEAKRCVRCDLAYGIEKFQIDTGLCMNCGLCVEACPFNALFFSYSYECAKYRRRELVLDKEKLLPSDRKQISGYARPDAAALLPKQTLLVERDKLKK